jgi:hypothetical protein
MRDEAAGVVDSVRETIAIGERGGVPTHVSHHKMIGRPNWGRSVETLKLIDEARARGVDVTLDQYPYTASSTSIQAGLMPKWLLEGGLKETQAKLKDPALRARARAEVAEFIRTDRGAGDPANVAIALCSWDPSLAGKNLATITKERGAEVNFENAAETALTLVDRGGCRGVPRDRRGGLARILKHPATMVASDGGIVVFGQGAPHPRSYGTFARVLGVYVREKHVITLEDAVHKMTALPASRLGIPDRGMLRAAMKADVVVFDPATVRDLATYENPHQYAEGFSLVVVNGAAVFENGAITAARPGGCCMESGESHEDESTHLPARRGSDRDAAACATPALAADFRPRTPYVQEGPVLPAQVPCGLGRGPHAGRRSHGHGERNTARGIRALARQHRQAEGGHAHRDLAVRCDGPIPPRRRRSRNGGCGFPGLGRLHDGRGRALCVQDDPPGAVSGRTPHIHCTVVDGRKRTLTTQFFIEGDPGNERDFLYRDLGRSAVVRDDAP